MNEYETSDFSATSISGDDIKASQDVYLTWNDIRQDIRGNPETTASLFSHICLMITSYIPIHIPAVYGRLSQQKPIMFLFMQLQVLTVELLCLPWG